MEALSSSPPPSSSTAEKHALFSPVLSIAHRCTHRGTMRSGKSRPCGIRDYPDSFPLGKRNQEDRHASTSALSDNKLPGSFLPNPGQRKEKKAVRDFPDLISNKGECVMRHEDSGHEEGMTEKPNADALRSEFPDSLSKGLIGIQTGGNVGKEGKKGKKAIRDFPCLEIDVVNSKQQTTGDTSSQIVSQRMEVNDLVWLDQKVFSTLESQSESLPSKVEQGEGEDGAKEAQIDVNFQTKEKEKVRESGFPVIPKDKQGKKAVRDFPTILKKKQEKKAVRDFPVILDDNQEKKAILSKGLIDIKTAENVGKEGKKVKTAFRDFPSSGTDVVNSIQLSQIEDDADGATAVDKQGKEIESVVTFQGLKKMQTKFAIRDLPDVDKPFHVIGKENLTKDGDRMEGDASPSDGEAQRIDTETPRTKEMMINVDNGKSDNTVKEKRVFKEPEYFDGIKKVPYLRSDNKPLDEIESLTETKNDQGHATPMSMKRKSKASTSSDSGKKFKKSSGKTDLNADFSNPKMALVETLRLFDSVRRKIVQDEEKYVKKQGRGHRVDLQTLALVKDQGYVQMEKVSGPIPGLDIGDIFCLRSEGSFARVHGPVQGGIDYLTSKDSDWDTPIAIGIVSNVGQDGEDNGEELIYNGQGGRTAGLKQISDQKMDRGNLAMDGSRKYKLPVRVIRGIKDANSPSGKVFVYDGLYLVVDTFIRKGSSGFDEFQFRLQRMPNQTEPGSDLFKLARELKNLPPVSRKNLVLQDLSNGEEAQPICVENTVDDEKAPSAFEYVTETRYPDGIEKIDTTGGCDCKGTCTPSSKCSCFSRNGDELPYLNTGTLVREKDYIIECGSRCSCARSCQNRVLPKIRLEVFKTHDCGWGVRSLEMIAAGSFVCEYTGKMVLGNEMIKSVGNKEYVLDLRRVTGKTPRWGNVPSIFPDRSPSDLMPDVGNIELFVDATHSGNVARFINHSCSPNLLVQKVLSHTQHDAKRPQIKLFAMDHIPPLRELTLDYGCPANDEDVIACLCGSSNCRGRL